MKPIETELSKLADLCEWLYTVELLALAIGDWEVAARDCVAGQSATCERRIGWRALRLSGAYERHWGRKPPAVRVTP